MIANNAIPDPTFRCIEDYKKFEHPILEYYLKQMNHYMKHKEIE